MNILGISAGFHDAAATLINSQGEILFAGHSERYSKTKHDSTLHSDLIADAVSYGKPNCIAYYERPWVKKTRQLYAGQYSELAQGWTVRGLLKDTVPDSAVEMSTSVIAIPLPHTQIGISISSYPSKLNLWLSSFVLNILAT
jgi:predicted NodU family carbamoyl transferase